MAQRRSPRSGYAANACKSPRSRGALAKGYEGRYGTTTFLNHADDKESVASSRPSRKQGVTTFTDPMNPFARALSKQITRIEAARDDNDRAGARTRNPGMIPRNGHVGCSERAVSEDGRHPLVAHSYSTPGDWRPAKRCPDHSPVASPGAVIVGTPRSMTSDYEPRSPRCSEGMAATLPDGSTPGKKNSGRFILVSENYLNDMKPTVKSRRPVTDKPSNNLQRMNDERVKLPAERRLEREITSQRPATSCGILPNSSIDLSSEAGRPWPFSNDEYFGGTRPVSARIRRSFSCDPRVQRSANLGETNEREDNYGFARKREVSGDWTRRGGTNLLHHTPGHNDEPPCTPRRSEQLAHKADERFREMVTHMKAANPEQRLHFEHFKARGEQTAGLITHREGGI